MSKKDTDVTCGITALNALNFSRKYFTMKLIFLAQNANSGIKKARVLCFQRPYRVCSYVFYVHHFFYGN